MKVIFAIIKKELLRVFKKPSIIFTLFIMPALLIYTIYSLIGGTIQNKSNELMNYKPKIVALLNNTNAKENLEETLQETNFILSIYQYSSPNELDDLKETYTEQLRTLKIDYLVICVDMITVGVYNIYYNSQASLHTVWLSITKEYIHYAFIESFYYVPDNEIDVFISDKPHLSQELILMASILPLMIMSFLFSGSMGVAPESIAGEKDRGTIATLLSTPVKTQTIAFGKIISLIILASLSALSSFTGVILSLPKIIGGSISIADYGVWNIILILLVIISTVAVIVSLISNISAISKSVQQASTLSIPLMLLSMLLGFSTIFTGGAVSSPFFYLIPLFNSSQILFQIFTLAVNPISLIITIISNLIYSFLFCLLLSKLFQNEKAMFQR